VVWPREWARHLFTIDDLGQYARAHGLVCDPERTRLADHEHTVRWELDSGEKKPTGSYITIHVQLDCDCSIRHLHAFAEQMRAQQVWDIATSGGRGGSTGAGTYMHARRKNLAT
jgi:hypothetical protein